MLSHSSVKVTWDQLSDITEYTISYTNTVSNISDSKTVKGGSSTLTGLAENSPYTITIQATNCDGRKSAFSSEVSVTTHAAGKSNMKSNKLEEMKYYNSTVPSSPPQNIMITSSYPASLTISWQPPVEIHNIPITGYVIHYIKFESQDAISYTVNVNVASRTTYTISRLDACVKYSIKIAAKNDERTGPFSQPVVQFSGEDGELNFCSLKYKYICIT